MWSLPSGLYYTSLYAKSRQTKLGKWKMGYREKFTSQWRFRLSPEEQAPPKICVRSTKLECKQRNVRFKMRHRWSPLRYMGTLRVKRKAFGSVDGDEALSLLWQRLETHRVFWYAGVSRGRNTLRARSIVYFSCKHNPQHEIFGILAEVTNSTKIFHFLERRGR